MWLGVAVAARAAWRVEVVVHLVVETNAIPRRDGRAVQIHFHVNVVAKLLVANKVEIARDALRRVHGDRRRQQEATLVPVRAWLVWRRAEHDPRRRAEEIDREPARHAVHDRRAFNDKVERHVERVECLVRDAGKVNLVRHRSGREEDLRWKIPDHWLGKVVFHRALAHDAEIQAVKVALLPERDLAHLLAIDRVVRERRDEHGADGREHLERRVRSTPLLPSVHVRLEHAFVDEEEAHGLGHDDIHVLGQLHALHLALDHSNPVAQAVRSQQLACTVRHVTQFHGVHVLGPGLDGEIRENARARAHVEHDLVLKVSAVLEHCALVRARADVVLQHVLLVQEHAVVLRERVLVVVGVVLGRLRAWRGRRRVARDLLLLASELLPSRRLLRGVGARGRHALPARRVEWICDEELLGIPHIWSNRLMIGEMYIVSTNQKDMFMVFKPMNE